MNVLHVAPSQAFIDKFIVPLSFGMLKEYGFIYLNLLPSEKHHDRIIGLNLDVKLKTNKFMVFVNAYKMITLIRTNHIGKVFLHTSIDSLIPMFLFRLFTRAELIYVNHGVPYIGYVGFLRYVLKLFEILNVGISSRTCTITKSMLPALDKCNFLKRKIEAFTPGSIAGVDLHGNINFYDLSLMKKVEKSKICNSEHVLVLYVGRPEVRKGLHDFISASRLMNTKFIFLLVGVECSDVVELDFDREFVIPLGYINDPLHLFIAADFLCVPSYHEGLGQVYLEAAASGTIPICCNIPGPTDFIVNNENGLSVNIHDAKSIADNIERLFANEDEMKRLSMNAFNSVIKYSRTNVIENNVRLL